jgi:hypothetical protein
MLKSDIYLIYLVARNIFKHFIVNSKGFHNFLFTFD